MAPDQEQLRVFGAAETGEFATLRTFRIADRLAVFVYLLHQAGASRRLLCIGGAGRESERRRECEDTDRSSGCTVWETACCGYNLRKTQIPCDFAHWYTVSGPPKNRCTLSNWRSGLKQVCRGARSSSQQFATLVANGQHGQRKPTMFDCSAEAVDSGKASCPAVRRYGQRSESGILR